MTGWSRISLLVMTMALTDIHAAKLPFKNYFNADGLPQSQVLTIQQDSRGYIWIGTYCGLGRYNGNRFDAFTTHEGLPSNYVYDIEEDRGGTLYAATSKGVFTITPDLTISRYLPINGDRIIRDLYLLSDSQILFSDDAGYYLYESGQTHVLLNSPSGHTRNRIIQTGGHIYFCTGRGLYRYEQREVVNIPAGVEKEGIICITAWNESLIIGTTEGIYNLREGQAEKMLSCPMVNTMISHMDSIWAGTNNGLYHYFGSRWQKFSESQGLCNEGILSLHLDLEYNLWIGTNSGLSKLAYRYFKSYSMDDGLPSNYIWCLYEDPVLGLLAAGENGMARFNGSQFISVDIPGLTLKQGYVRSICRASDGTLWLGTFRDGFFVVQSGVVRHYPNIDGLYIRSVFCILQDRAGTIWLGTSNGVLKYSEGKYIHYGRERGVPDSIIWHMVEGPGGEIYIATDNGLAVYDEEKGFTIPPFARSLSLKTIRNIQFEPDGSMWIGTNGDGLFVWDGREMIQYSRTNGFIDNFIWAIVSEEPGIHWVGTNRGIVRMEDEKAVVFNMSDGLPGDEMTLNTALRDASGDLWFGLLPGVLQVRTSLLTKNPLPPMVSVTRVKTNFRTMDLPEQIILKPEEHEFTLSIDALSFQDEQEVKIRYRLQGSSEWAQWSEPGNNHLIRYTNLPPGEYSLQATACNNFGVWSDPPLTLPVTILPSWHETGLFRTSAVIGFLLLVFLATRYRMQRIKREQIRLEQLVKKRTEDLYTASITDPLLGIFNRRYIDERMESEIQDARRHGDAICIALIDLDNFKEVNDRKGHIAGDEVLKCIADLLCKTIRSGDALARYGGDEFMIVFFRTDEIQIPHRIEDIITMIREHPFAINGMQMRLTASIGAVSHRFSKDSEENYDNLLSAADSALYEVKNSGGDAYRMKEI